jgi:hypothetical protein
MSKNIRFEDTLSYKTYETIGGILNWCMRWGTFQQTHASYTSRVYYNMANVMLAYGICFTIIGYPVAIMMIKTFKKYNAKAQFWVYLVPTIHMTFMGIFLLYNIIFN